MIYPNNYTIQVIAVHIVDGDWYCCDCWDDTDVVGYDIEIAGKNDVWASMMMVWSTAIVEYDDDSYCYLVNVDVLSY